MGSMVMSTTILTVTLMLVSGTSSGSGYSVRGEGMYSSLLMKSERGFRMWKDRRRASCSSSSMISVFYLKCQCSRRTFYAMVVVVFRVLYPRGSWSWFFWMNDGVTLQGGTSHLQ